MNRRDFAARSAATLVLAALGAPAARAALVKGGDPIRFVVPFGPGGPSDTVARAIGAKIGPEMGVTVVIDNRAGGGGVIGANAVLSSKADGRTLFVASNGAMIINPVIRNDLRYDPEKDFRLVASMARAPVFIFARADLEAKTVAEMVQLAKAKPLSAGSAGIGNITHLAQVNFASQAKIQLNHIPFSGDAAALSALAAGTIDLSFNSLIAALPLLATGRIRALAILDDQVDPALPKVPTLKDSGYPGTSAAAWFGLVAPSATPDDVVDEINKAVNVALAQPDIKERLRSVGFTALPGSIADFKRMYDDEVRTWRPLAKRLGLKVE